ncbi:hypothetical protein BOTBODRAFT_25920 [Botryobasidium botryosum FD-172 SS1]|uniref:Uncharacterized protein n=1 Tax=Botryobasidium botryosum (strain FD-172 SS1) TaxID=930990 RepID=A0A067NBH5_BOTB1|nr:hypothetical protein BOTBODRAFT_25920 [Botryobasidium botryosum FD-172 SS1]
MSFRSPRGPRPSPVRSSFYPDPALSPPHDGYYAYPSHPSTIPEVSDEAFEENIPLVDNPPRHSRPHSSRTPERPASAVSYADWPEYDPDQFTVHLHDTPTTASRTVVSVPPPAPGHPLFPKYFERPVYSTLVRHTIVVAISAPVIYLGLRGVQGLPLFWVRVIVGGVCGIVGLALGLSLITMARRGLEAAMWATIIHESMAGDGVPLHHFGQIAYDPMSPLSAIILLYRRLVTYRGTKRSKRIYDSRPWSLFIIFFIILAILSASFTFILSRIAIITTASSRQHTKHYETTVIGDLSADDVQRAQQQLPAFSNYIQTWSLSSFASSTSLPLPVTFDWKGDKIYFAETSPEQLVPTGLGYGTFTNRTTIQNKGDNETDMPPTDEGQWDEAKTNGGILHWPRWGIRIHCQKLPDMNANLAPVSAAGFTYTFIPRTFVRSLFSSLSIPIPAELDTLVDIKNKLEPNDTAPVGLNVNDVSIVGKFPNNGVGHSFFSSTASTPGWSGWLGIEVVLIRLNTTYTPRGRFGVYGFDTSDGTQIGYDAAVCVEEVSQYVVEAYNSTVGAPRTLRIVTKGNTTMPLGKNSTQLQGVRTTLSSEDKWSAWVVAHDNSRNTILKDNGRDYWWVPSPTSVGFTTGSGPDGYTTLTPANVESTIAAADASNLLPYLTGSAPLLAYSYPDQTLAYTHVNGWWLLGTLLVILFLGYAAAFFVPSLPLGMPRRDFGVLSCLTLEGEDLPKSMSSTDSMWTKNTELEDLRRRIGAIKVRYGV